MKIKNNPKVSYIHGRLGPHVMHGRLAKSIQGQFQMVDKYKIWNDKAYNKLYTIYAWFYNAFAFKNPKQFDYFLVSGPYFSPIIMKFFRLNNKNQKVMVHLGDQTMYFLKDGQFGKFMTKLLIWLLNQYDVLLCEGQMANDLAGMNGINKPIRFTTYLGVPKERLNKLLQVQPNWNSNHFVFISTGPRGWRTYYKGIDLMIKAFNIAKQERNDIRFSIIGKWDDDIQAELMKDCEANTKESIDFLGHTDNIDALLSKGCFYYHTSRGDAFPTVVLEGMTAGLIPLVSEWTGSKEVVEKLSPSHIVELDVNSIAKKLVYLADLNLESRQKLSEKARKIASSYTEEFALNHYQETFAKIQTHFS